MIINFKISVTSGYGHSTFSHVIFEFKCLRNKNLSRLLFKAVPVFDDLLFCIVLGHEGSGKLPVTFYNGETVEIDPGVALRIPLATFDRIVTELQLPESQRRKIKLASSTEAPPYDGRGPPAKTTWTRPFSPPRTVRDCDDGREKAQLNAKIEEQLERNKHLLKRLELDESAGTKTAKGISFVEPPEDCDCGVFQSEDLYDDDYEEEDENIKTFDVGTDTGK